MKKGGLPKQPAIESRAASAHHQRAVNPAITE